MNARFASPSWLKELADGLDAMVHEADRPSLRPRELQPEIDSESLVNRRGHLCRSGRAVDRITADFIRGAHDTASLDGPPAQQDCPGLRPMIAPAGRVDLGRSPELPHRENDGLLEQASRLEIFQ